MSRISLIYDSVLRVGTYTSFHYRANSELDVGGKITGGISLETPSVDVLTYHSIGHSRTPPHWPLSKLPDHARTPRAFVYVLRLIRLRLLVLMYVSLIRTTFFIPFGHKSSLPNCMEPLGYMDCICATTITHY